MPRNCDFHMTHLELLALGQKPAPKNERKSISGVLPYDGVSTLHPIRHSRAIHSRRAHKP
jgi:hypothetical protein